jgi:hypothetical protein
MLLALFQGKLCHPDGDHPEAPDYHDAEPELFLSQGADSVAIEVVPIKPQPTHYHEHEIHSVEDFQFLFSQHALICKLMRRSTRAGETTKTVRAKCRGRGVHEAALRTGSHLLLILDLGFVQAHENSCFRSNSLACAGPSANGPGLRIRAWVSAGLLTKTAAIAVARVET